MALQGLSGAGKRSVQRILNFHPSQILSIPEGRLTQPPYDDGSEAKQAEPNNGALRRTHICCQFIRRTVSHSTGSHCQRAQASAASKSTANRMLTPNLLCFVCSSRCAMPIPRFLPTARAIVLVVDSCDLARLTPPAEPLPPLSASFVQDLRTQPLAEQHAAFEMLRTRMNVKQMLQALLKQDKLQGRPLLVVANKQDQEGVMSTDEIARLLNLAALDGVRDWRIAGCNALTGDGLTSAFQWLNVIIAADKLPSAESRANE